MKCVKNFLDIAKKIAIKDNYLSKNNYFAINYILF